jgi:seryl-tRNA synthetase
MLDIKLIRQDPDRVKQELKNRNINVDIDELLNLDIRRRELLVEVEELRAEKNKASKLIPALKGDEREELIKEMREVSKTLNNLEPQLKDVEEEFNNLMIKLPNLSHESVPIGKDETGNVVEKKWGKKPDFQFKVKDHEELGLTLDIIDKERGAKVSGSRFFFLKNEGVILEFALINYVNEKLLKKGFTPIVPPVLVKQEAMFGTGFFPAEEWEYYETKTDNLYLIGTSEVPMCAYHAHEILGKDKLPLKYSAFSTCFRRESGTYGKDTRGMFRVHQFDKVEMFIFSDQENSWNHYNYLLSIAEKILQELGLHYQVVNMCTGDIGAPNAKKYDIEVWFPWEKRYRELVSCSHDTDFQARRLGIKYKDENGKLKLVHTMNSTACAIGRTITAILENYQQKDGSVLIPNILKPYMRGIEKITPKK